MNTCKPKGSAPDVKAMEFTRNGKVSVTVLYQTEPTPSTKTISVAQFQKEFEVVNEEKGN